MVADLQIKWLLCSNILDLDYLGECSRSEIYHSTEFLDLFHFCTAQQQRRIAPFFDQHYYLERYPDVALAAASPLRHFVERGVSEWRNPHPLIDLRYMQALRDDVFPKEPQIELLIDCLKRNLVDPSPFFSVREYHQQLNGAERAEPALLHYIKAGAARGFAPIRLFDAKYYRRHYADVPDSNFEAFLHFVRQGDAERRDPSAGFDSIAYEQSCDDVAHSQFGPLEHYLRFGRFEGRDIPSSGSAVRGGQIATAPTLEWRAPVQASAWQTNQDRLGRKIRERKADRVVRFREIDVRPVRRDVDPEDILPCLQFPEFIHPAIDVLIPCYNEFEYTVDCLHSIMLSETSVSFRITVIDDTSTDDRMRRLGDIPGIRYHRNPENLHFLRSCNRAFEQTDSPFVLLLNNDVQLTRGAIDNLFRCLTEGDDVAAVGPKVLYPNGRLQESGCVVRADGTTRMVGVGDDPAENCFTYRRDVPYVSAACVLLRRSDVGKSLFDIRFAPAYCEDTDLCLRLRAAGKRIVYSPEAVIIHHLSVSTSKASITRRLQLATRNQDQLYRKWDSYLAESARVRTLCFYLPQFHPIKQNDLWWGKGFTEWTNVAKALPSFSGHYQPHLPADLGYYDLRAVETLREQQKLAERYWIEGFVLYYYNFGTERVLDAPLHNLLAHPDIPFRFCLCWANENWTKHWDGGVKEVLLEQQYGEATFGAVCDDAVQCARDPRALTVNGKPLFLVYRPLLFPDVRIFADASRKAFRNAGWPDGHLVYVESMETSSSGVSPQSIGFDACVEFPPQGVGVRTSRKMSPTKLSWDGHVFDYEETVVAATARPEVAYTRYPCVFPSWDNTARQPLKGTTFVDIGPELFAKYVEAKVDTLNDFLVGEERFLFVNAWNEWAEGAHLEPDRAYGHAWLESLRNGVMSATFPGELN